MKAFRSIVTLIPNTITSLNLLTGCLAIVLAFNNNLFLASILIFVAGVFDFLDGMAARVLKAYSELGKSLDSLADMVSFGLAPSVIMFQLLIIAIRKDHPGFDFNSGTFWEIVVVCSAFIIAVFSALRLANFNIDTRQTVSFIGVPTPANAFLIASVYFVGLNYPWVIQLWVLIPSIFLLSYLLVAEIPMLSFKFKNLKFRDNLSRYILAGFSIVLFSIFRISAFPLIFVLYVVLSLVDNPQKAESKTK